MISKFVYRDVTSFELKGRSRLLGSILNSPMASKRKSTARAIAMGIERFLDEPPFKHRIENLWKDTKTKLGEEAAGKSLQHFMFQNTKVRVIQNRDIVNLVLRSNRLRLLTLSKKEKSLARLTSRARRGQTTL